MGYRFVMQPPFTPVFLRRRAFNRLSSRRKKRKTFRAAKLSEKIVRRQFPAISITQVLDEQAAIE